MSALEQLCHLEIEFLRLFQSQSISEAEAASIHTSYALQQGYEPLLRSLGQVDAAKLTEAKNRLAGKYDPRQMEAAFVSLRRILPVSA